MARRARADEQKRARAAAAAQWRQRQTEFADAIGQALVRPRAAAERQIEEALSGTGVLRGPLFAKVRGHTPSPKLAPLLRRIARDAPRLVEADYIGAAHWLARLRWIRPLETWEVRGKGRDALFRSLAEHLLARYPTPPFLWNALFEDDAETLAPVVEWVAHGASLIRAVQSGRMPTPLTRRMCHEIMQSPARTKVLTAIRKAQWRAHGVEPRLLAPWLATDVGGRLGSAETERFWLGMVEWLARNPGVGPHQIGPLIDYVTFREREDGAFRFKGRSAPALLRAMRRWHIDLARARSVENKTFRPSGFRALLVDRSLRLKNGARVKRLWRFDEILSGAALAKEGRKMHHCVYSYAWAIEAGQTSIWSLTLDEGSGPERKLTVEVRNETGRIVQARGAHNRPATSQEHRVLIEWAGRNRLEVKL